MKYSENHSGLIERLRGKCTRCHPRYRCRRALIGLEEKEREEIWKKIIPIADSYCPLYSSIYVDSPVNFLSCITWMCIRAPLVYAGDYNGTHPNMGIRKDNVEPILILLNIRCVYKYVCNERIMRVERIYDSPRGGVRVLVDRLWPRGISKDAAVLNKWAKELTPSTELRKAYHDGMVWQEFKIAYMLELENVDDTDWQYLDDENIVLLTAAKKVPNHAHVLLEFWQRRNSS